MLKQIRQSLITRLMMYFLIAGLVFVILFGINIAHGLRVHFKQEILPNIAQYLTYIALDIGSPPDLQKAQLLSDNLSFELSISGPDVNWQSHQNLASIDSLKLEQGPEPYQEYRIAHRRGNNFVALKVGDYEYMYVIGRLFKGKSYQRNIGLIILVILSMALLFLLIRSSLKPLKKIASGVNDIAQGDLEHPIKVHGSTEFKDLSKGINDMALQIKSMLEGKHQLLLAISHELRSPITRAKVNLELMTDQSVKQALVDDISEMEDLITQILESERLNQQHAVLNKTEIQLDELVNDVIQKYFPDAGIKSELESVTLFADKTRLVLLVKNLLDNALKYSVDSESPPKISIKKEASSVVLEVEDKGSGMSNEELEKITQPFYRIDPARLRSTGGVGLGLSLCQLIVQAHEGEMTFKSKIGKGTVVRVIL